MVRNSSRHECGRLADRYFGFALFSLPFVLLVHFPPGYTPDRDDHKDKDRNEGKAGAVANSVRVNGGVLLSNQFSVRRSFVGSFQIRSYRFLFVDADAFSVCANVGLIEDSARQKIELLFLKRHQEPAANLGSGDNFVERNAPHFTLLPQMLAKGAHRFTPSSRVMCEMIASSNQQSAFSIQESAMFWLVLITDC